MKNPRSQPPGQNPHYPPHPPPNLNPFEKEGSLLRKRANETINYLLKSRNCSLADLLPFLTIQVRNREISRVVLQVLIERIEQQLERKEKHGEWNAEVRINLEEAKKTLEGFAP